MFQFALAFIAQSSAQKSVLWWAAKHRHHHLHSDTEHDTHSPRQRGFLYSHLGWIFYREHDTTELVKVARKEGDKFDCATWLHRAKNLPKEGFKVEVERHLTGKETEPWEILYFKVYKSQLLVIERALETTALMLGTDKSRGYCLEMICADFLAGANLGEREPAHDEPPSGP